MKHECEQLTNDIKQVHDWLKSTEQQLNKYVLSNLNTADEKNEATKKLLVKIDEECSIGFACICRRNWMNLLLKKRTVSRSNNVQRIYFKHWMTHLCKRISMISIENFLV